MVAAVYEDFLTRHGAKEKSHSGRTLYDHLKGTHDLLRDWDNSEVVCLGGLFHSIYGTRQFQHASLPLAERHTLQKLIGPEAEYLAYVFCVTDRPKVFLDSASIITRHFYDYHRKRMFEVSHLVRSQLIEIEAANLIDQGSASAGALERLAQSPISPAARAAIFSRMSR